MELVQFQKRIFLYQVITEAVGCGLLFITFYTTKIFLTPYPAPPFNRRERHLTTCLVILDYRDYR